MKRDRASRSLRYHVLHWLDALTWPASWLVRIPILAIRGVRALFARRAAH